MRTILIVVLLLGMSALPATARQHAPDYVSMVQLMANPQHYNGRVVAVMGFLDFTKENPELFFSYEAYQNMLGSNGVMIRPSAQMDAHRSELDLKYVQVVGKFTAEPANFTQGVISDITRFQMWSDPKHPRLLIMEKLWPRNPGELPHTLPPATINSFFQGQLPPGNACARYVALYLHALGEKPLADSVSRGVSKVFRVVVESRPHNFPVAVRLLIETNGSGEVVVKVAGEQWLAGALAVNRTSRVSREDVSEFLRRLNSSNFWSMPAVPQINSLRVVLGDASWMLEGVQGSSYHVVCRSTSGLGSLRDAVMFLVRSVGKVNLTPSAHLPGDNH